MGEEVIEMRVEETALSRKPHFVLVHGIGGGSWCWYKIRCLMENAGYKVSCVDLKGSGIDQGDANSILSFDDYNKPLMDLLSSLPDNEQGVPELSSFGEVYELGFGLGSNEAPTSAIVKKEFQRQIIYQMSPREDSILASMLLRPGPILALKRAQFKEEENGDGIEKVKRVYIKTKHDHVIKPQQQEAMIKRWPPSQVFLLDCDHSPFFSSPFLLFGLLVKAAASVG
uniref:AB hydrolase-1 domain-containing protein n=1 Tax=Manihot esculenta TaxID=3983 RepID=A0A2C9V214_MANES